MIGLKGVLRLREAQFMIICGSSHKKFEENFTQ
jgi:hypothetical protein